MTPDEIMAAADIILREKDQQQADLDRAVSTVHEWMILGGPLPAPRQ